RLAYPDPFYDLWSERIETDQALRRNWNRIIRTSLPRLLLFAWGSFPSMAQLSEVGAALGFKPKILYAPVAPGKIPFVEIAMLENAASLEIVLAHRRFEWIDARGHEEVGLPHFSKSEMKGFFIPMHELIIEVRLLIE